MKIIDEPFRCHLFGRVQADNSSDDPEWEINPPGLSTPPHRHPPRMSRTSSTMVETKSALSLSSSHLLGLGIYGPQDSSLHLLAPRPSLAAVHARTSLHNPPPTVPLPPLPAQMPGQNCTWDPRNKGSLAPRPRISLPPWPLHPATVRIVPPSPVLSVGSAERLGRGAGSISSLYSRSTSGDIHGARLKPRRDLHPEGDRTCTSPGAHGVQLSVLELMRPARPFNVNESTSSEIHEKCVGLAVSDEGALSLSVASTPEIAIGGLGIYRQRGECSCGAQAHEKSSGSGAKAYDISPLNVRQKRVEWLGNN